MKQVYRNTKMLHFIYTDLEISRYFSVCKSNTFQSLYYIWTKTRNLYEISDEIYDSGRMKDDILNNIILVWLPVVDPRPGGYDRRYRGAGWWSLLPAGAQLRPDHQLVRVLCRRVGIVDDVLEDGWVVVVGCDPGQVDEVGNARHHAYVARWFRSTCVQPLRNVTKRKVLPEP